MQRAMRKGFCATCAIGQRNTGSEQPRFLQSSLLYSYSFHVSQFDNAQPDLFLSFETFTTVSVRQHFLPYPWKMSILRTGPLITGLRLANWSDDRTLLNKLLSLYHTSIRTIRTPSRRGRDSMPQSFIPLTTTTTSRSVANNPLHTLHLTLEAPVSLALLDWLTKSNPTIRPRVLELELRRCPDPAVFTELLAVRNTNIAISACATNSHYSRRDPCCIAPRWIPRVAVLGTPVCRRAPALVRIYAMQLLRRDLRRFLSARRFVLDRTHLGQILNAHPLSEESLQRLNLYVKGPVLYSDYCS